MSHNREWMYKRFDNVGGVHLDFKVGLDTFMEFASSQPMFMDGEKIKCPCKKCDNIPYMEQKVVRLHILKYGFVRNYYTWIYQGETSENRNFDIDEGSNAYHTMVMDLVGEHFSDCDDNEESPNPKAQQFYDMLKAADQELWPGCTKHTKLSLVARLMSLKAENHFSEKCFDQILELMKEIVPEDSCVPDNFYSAKKLLQGMGLPVVKIDCCPNHCMIYWNADSELVRCKICGTARYKKTTLNVGSQKRKLVACQKMYYFPLTPRLQRLYASKATAEYMRWHASSVDDEMRHPAHSAAWKHFNNTHLEFASEIRNVRLGLSTDGFQPFGQSGKQYSSWPVILTPYNLPPWMCMKEQFMFLTILVPGPRNPKYKIDVFLQPLISELIELWEGGVLTYDVSLKQNFQMRAALMWTISDFPAYGMLSGWSTAGRLACPHCMEQTDAFTLEKSGKQSWFDNHCKFLPHDNPFRRNKKAFRKNHEVTGPPPETRSGEEILALIDELGLMKVTELGSDEINTKISKGIGWKKRSIFWDLPYWSSLLIRHILDVMHVEKNVFDNIFNTVMNVEGKTKDTSKSREELNQYCNRPALKRNEANGKYPKACYTLEKDERHVLCEWVKQLRFPDGYVSNMSRCVDMRKLKMFGMKSHDCHVLMQRILPIAFRELLPLNVWKAITEISLFFKELTSRNIKSEDMSRLHDSIPIILCKLERIFPPSFFDCMEHLPVHLPDEARVAGPVQYRWMYPFERYLKKLKTNVKNKARVEGSICNAYLVEEASTFCSYYFEEHVRTKWRNEPRNYDGPVDEGIDDDPGMLKVFKQSGRPFGSMTYRSLDPKEYAAAHLYVLLNCVEVTEKFIDLFVDQLQAASPTISSAEIGSKLEKEFPAWFEAYVNVPSNNVNKIMRDLAKGPLLHVKTYSGYMVNGYKFQTLEHGTRRATMNSGVCIKGENYGSDQEIDYYGRLLEVCELEYPGLPLKKATLFKCEWFDPSPLGTSIHPEFKLVSINHTRRYDKYEPFVLASQASQVYYCSYPSLNRSKKDWWEVCKIKARSKIEVSSVASESLPLPFQEDELFHFDKLTIDDDMTLVHPDGGLVDIEDVDDELDEENEYSNSEDNEDLNDDSGDSD